MEQKFLIPASNGRKIPLWVVHPDGIDLTSRENILIFFLHGIGGNSNSKDDTAWLDYMKADGPASLYREVLTPYQGKNFIVIAPQLSKWDAGIVNTDCRNGTWPTWYLKTVYDWAMSKFPNDPQRCILTGLSYGGGGLINFATLNSMHGKMFSSIVSVCGVNGISDGFQNLNNVSMAFIHAQDDTVVGHWSSVQAVNSFNATNPNSSVKPALVLPRWGGHKIWDFVYSRQTYEGFNFWDFILSHKFINQVVVDSPVVEPAPPPPVKRSGVEIIGVPSIISVTKEVSTVELDGSQSKGGKGWWDSVRIPAGAWMQTVAPGKSKINALKEGQWIVKFTDQDDYGKTISKEVLIVVAGTPIVKKIVSYIVTPVFSDGSKDSEKTLLPGATLPV